MKANSVHQLKRQVTVLQSNLSRALLERDTLRKRAIDAEAEAAEWKERFDLLLRKVST